MIKNANELQGRLQQIVRLASQPNPSRAVIADELMQLAEDVQAGVQTRPIHEIAREIRQDWKNVNYAAKPYLEAMESLDKITDNYGADMGRSIVNYFLGNASSWRGPKAKEIKDELKKMLK
jgi:hypothetical protein